ncbi:GAF domain-containing protein [Acidithiobacillus sp. IBUN Pt1247-S3]|uniref:GAF domain-containing protein n=1 Tax=Acidithiobacillus sp. IBUN Pt1247-S3 TaxID=3166642 RepID=UPI0034E5ACAE
MPTGHSIPLPTELELHREEFLAAVEEAARGAFAELTRETEVAAYLASLDSATLQHLQEAQHLHFAWLLTQDNPQARDERSRELGAVHQRLGLPADWLVLATGLFSAHLRRATAPFVRFLPQLDQDIPRRLAMDLLVQLRTMRALDAEEEQIIERIDVLLLSESDEQQLLQRMLSKIVLISGVDGAWIGKPSNGSLQAIAIAGKHMAEYLEQVNIRVDQGAQAQGPMGKAWRSGKPVAIDDLQNDPLFLPWQDTLQSTGAWRSTMAFPVQVAGKQEALFGVYSQIPRYFSSANRRRSLMHLTRMLGIALEKQDQRERLERSNHLYQIFLSEGDILMRSRSSHAILRRTCHRLVENGLFSSAFVVRPDSNGYIVPISAAGKNSNNLS